MANPEYIELRQSNTHVTILPDTLPNPYRTVTRLRVLTPEEEYDLGVKTYDRYTTLVALWKKTIESSPFTEKKIKEGNLAGDKLVAHNLRWALKRAKESMGKGVEFEDLFQMGSVGLMRATLDYNPYTGKRFLTYANHWISHFIQRTIEDQGSTIRYPSHIVQLTNRVRYAMARLSLKLNSRPTNAEIANYLGVSVKQVDNIFELVKPIVSLDIEVGEDGNSRLVDFIPNGQEISDDAIKGEFSSAIQDALNVLTPRERRVIELRHGLTGKKPYSLEEVGAEFGVTRERIRQIEQKALGKLRKPNIAERLKGLLNP